MSKILGGAPSSDASAMVERVAEAIRRRRAPRQGVHNSLSGHGEPVEQVSDVELARAAIEAMREPTEEMVDAAWDARSIERQPDQHPDDVDNDAVGWRAMIDTALTTRHP